MKKHSIVSYILCVAIMLCIMVCSNAAEAETDNINVSIEKMVATVKSMKAAPGTPESMARCAIADQILSLIRRKGVSGILKPGIDSIFSLLEDDNDTIKEEMASAIGMIGPAAWYKLPALREILYKEQEKALTGNNNSSANVRVAMSFAIMQITRGQFKDRGAEIASYEKHIRDKVNFMINNTKIQSVRSILLKDWDPLGIGTNPNLADEYDGFIGGIASLIETRSNFDAINQHLIKIETELEAPTTYEERTNTIQALQRLF